MIKDDIQGFQRSLWIPHIEIEIKFRKMFFVRHIWFPIVYKLTSIQLGPVIDKSIKYKVQFIVLCRPKQVDKLKQS